MDENRAPSHLKDTLPVPSPFRLPCHSNSDGTRFNYRAVPRTESLPSQSDDSIPLSQSMARASLESSTFTITDSQETVLDPAPTPMSICARSDLGLSTPTQMSLCGLPTSTPMSICTPSQSVYGLPSPTPMSICTPSQGTPFPSQISSCVSTEGTKALVAGLEAAAFEMHSGYSSFRHRVQKKRQASTGGRSIDSLQTTSKSEDNDSSQESQNTDEFTGGGPTVDAQQPLSFYAPPQQDDIEDHRGESQFSSIGGSEAQPHSEPRVDTASCLPTLASLRQTISRFPQPPSHASNLPAIPPNPISNIRSKVRMINRDFAQYRAGGDSATLMGDGTSSVPKDGEGRQTTSKDGDGRPKGPLSAPYRGRIPKAARASFVARSNAYAAGLTRTTHKRTVLEEIPDSQGEEEDEDEDGDEDETEPVNNVQAQNGIPPGRIHNNNTVGNAVFNREGHRAGNNESRFTYPNHTTRFNNNTFPGIQPSGQFISSIEYNFPTYRAPLESASTFRPAASYQPSFSGTFSRRAPPVQHRVRQLRDNNENMIQILNHHCNYKLDLFSAGPPDSMDGAPQNETNQYSSRTRRTGLDFVNEMRVAVENVKMLCVAQMETLRRMETAYLVGSDSYGAWAPRSGNAHAHAHGPNTRQKRQASSQSQAGNDFHESSSDGSRTVQQDSTDGSSSSGRRTRLRTDSQNGNGNVRSAPVTAGRPNVRSVPVTAGRPNARSAPATAGNSGGSNVIGGGRQEQSESFMDVEETTDEDTPLVEMRRS